MFVIFGATGDLARKKLLVALFDLYLKDLLPKRFKIIGFARDENSNQSFRQFVKDVIKEHKRGLQALTLKRKLDDFLTNVSYQQGFFEDGASYLTLSKNLIALEEEYFGQCTNKLFYLAVPPSSYRTIFQNLADSGLSLPCSDETGWTRILVEKPFGRDLSTAQELDTQLGQLFKEEQIFRIDHYLAKETIQNILAFRFSNLLFEPLWNKEHIEKVLIRVWEKAGVGTRGQFYEDVGALRDVGQNHLLQMLSLIAMEDPIELETKRLRDQRATVLRQLRPTTPEYLKQHTWRGQYAGYREEHSVTADSQTETFFRLTAFIDNERWYDVPFVLESGKKMAHDLAEICIFFKQTTHCLCPPGAEHHHQNVLTFRIQPNEGISLVFFAKKPGFATELEPKKLSFRYHEAESDVMPPQLPDAYERVLFDCIRGDQTLFTSTAEVKAAWEFITPILENWQSTPLHTYEPGTAEPIPTIH